jgi:PEP-CTERM motif
LFEPFYREQREYMKKLLLATLLLAILAPAAFAVPALQVYMPGGTYNSSTDTWESAGLSFEIWVIAANIDSKPLYDITLVAALGKGVAPVNDGLNIGGHSYQSNEFAFGAPPDGDPDNSLPPHDIYETNYAEFSIGNSSGPFETVYDMEPGGGGSATGRIYKYQVEVTGYDWVHFDAYAYNDRERRIFAPFSHDGETGSSIPEPATMVLMGLGLAGAGLARRFRK